MLEPRPIRDYSWLLGLTTSCWEDLVPRPQALVAYMMDADRMLCRMSGIVLSSRGAGLSCTFGVVQMTIELLLMNQLGDVGPYKCYGGRVLMYPS